MKRNEKRNGERGKGGRNKMILGEEETNGEIGMGKSGLWWKMWEMMWSDGDEKE